MGAGPDDESSADSGDSSLVDRAERAAVDNAAMHDDPEVHTDLAQAKAPGVVSRWARGK